MLAHPNLDFPAFWLRPGTNKIDIYVYLTPSFLKLWYFETLFWELLILK